MTVSKVHLLLALSALLLGCGTAKVSFQKDREARFYREFGSQSHYFRAAADSLGVSFYHGFNLYYWNNPVSLKTFGTASRRYLRSKGNRYLFVYKSTLSPMVVTLQKLGDRDAAPAPAPPGTAHPAVSQKTFSQGQSRYLLTAAADVPPEQWRSDSSLWHLPQLFVDDIYGSILGDTVSAILDAPLPATVKATRAFRLSKSNYLFPLYVLDRLTQRSIDTNLWATAAANYLSFAGEYLQAQTTFDLIARAQSFPMNDSQKLRCVPALPYLYRMAREREVLLINENHVQPLHRRFLDGMLDSLYAFGYRQLFIEDLFEEGAELTARGYPMQSSGYYLAEPSYANLVRHALRLGFELHPYDSDAGGYEREEGQAAAIASKMRQSSGKAIVYCGYNHLSRNREDSLMGSILERLTHRKTLIVSQTQFTERGLTVNESNLYRYLSGKYSLAQPSIVMMDGEPYVPERYRHDIDLMIVHPRSEVKNGRPAWQTQLGTEPYSIALNGAQYKGRILQLFHAAELKQHSFWDLVPIVNIPLAEENDLHFTLPKGSFVLMVTDTSRSVVLRKPIAL